jgi:gluconate 5-dehydrogenase
MADLSLFDLTGRVALITGSSQGLGFALARGLARAGATVVLNGRTRGKLEQAAKALRDEGLSVRTTAFDVTDEAGIRAALPTLELEAGGPIEVLVNNAGIQHRAPMVELDAADWRKVVETNLTSAFLVGREVARGMLARKHGKIINTCSLLSEVGRNTIAPYTAAKGGLKMLTKAMAVEWGPHGVQANGIGPGYFMTEMTKPLVQNPEFDAWVRKRTPAGRWGQPEELTGAAVFLASRASDFVNGQILYVDGGMLASL